MPLEDINESIYTRDFHPSAPARPEMSTPPESREHVHKPPEGNRWSDTPMVSLTPSQVQALEKKRQNRHRQGALLLALFLIICLAIGGYFGKRFFIFDPTNVSLDLSGPEVVKTGDKFELVFTYQNRNWSGVTNAEIIVNYPESFRPDSGSGWEVALSRATYAIGSIAGRGSGKIVLSGTLQSFQKKTAFFKGALRSSPNGITNATEITSQWTILVDASALTLNITGPPTIVLGQSVEYVVEYRNESTSVLENMRLVVEYPEGFMALDFDPKPSQRESVWLLGSISPGMSGSIRIKGEVRGSEGDARRLLVRLGKELGDGTFLSLAQQEKVTRVVSPPLVVNLTINGSSQLVVDPKDVLTAKVVFENTSAVGIRDIVASVILDTSIIDLRTLKLPPGATYNRESQQLVFRASEIPALRILNPKEYGELSFSFQLRPDILTLGKKEISFTTVALLDSPDLPHGQNTESFVPRSERVVKIASPVRADVTLVPAASEPTPLRVGESKSYILRMGVDTALNPLTEATLALSLPSVVRSMSHVSGDQSTYHYNDRTGEFVWNIGVVGPGTLAAKLLVLQIEIVPSPGSANSLLKLINDGVLKGVDTYAERKIEIPISKSYLSEMVQAENSGE